MVSPVHGDYRRCQAEIPRIVLSKFPRPALYSDLVPPPLRGVRTSRTRGGMRWTLAARETSAACWRTAKSCRSDAPMLASSLREAAQATVSNKPGHRGEREVSRKTIARGMPGRSGVTVVTMLVCLFYFACEAAGASRARHSLRPLISEDGTFLANLARNVRRDREAVFTIESATYPIVNSK